MNWLDGLAETARTYTGDQSPTGMRVFTRKEQEHLGEDSLGFLSFLESAGVLPAKTRELVMDRAMAVEASPIPLEDLKIIVLMAFWSQGTEPDALILDELFVDAQDRLIH